MLRFLLAAALVVAISANHWVKDQDDADAESSGELHWRRDPDGRSVQGLDDICDKDLTVRASTQAATITGDPDYVWLDYVNGEDCADPGSYGTGLQSSLVCPNGCSVDLLPSDAGGDDFKYLEWDSQTDVALHVCKWTCTGSVGACTYTLTRDENALPCYLVPIDHRGTKYCDPGITAAVRLSDVGEGSDVDPESDGKQYDEWVAVDKCSKQTAQTDCEGDVEGVAKKFEYKKGRIKICRWKAYQGNNQDKLDDDAGRCIGHSECRLHEDWDADSRGDRDSDGFDDDKHKGLEWCPDSDDWAGFLADGCGDITADCDDHFELRPNLRYTVCADGGSRCVSSSDTCVPETRRPPP
jgi:hypothetical protein